MVRQSGPILSIDHESVMAPWRLTDPKVLRSPETRQRSEGLTMLPLVSVPIANGSRPAATAAADPALEPLEPSFGSQGLSVSPPNHLLSIASAPRLSLATITAPAASSRSTTAAS